MKQSNQSNPNSELKLYIETNKDLFQMYVDDGAKLQISMDILQPLIKPFNERFPEVNLNGNCTSCILDMISWHLNNLKKEDEKK